MTHILRIGWPAGINVLKFLAGDERCRQDRVRSMEPKLLQSLALPMKILHFGFMSMVGFTLGTSALLGQFLGSKELLKAWMVGAQAIRISGWIMLAFGAAVFAGASPIIKLFFDVTGNA